MNRQAVIGILKKVFTYYGYTISSSDICDLLAEKERDHLFIKYYSDVNLNSIKHFSNNVQKYGGKGILVSESFDEKTRAFALDEKLILWDRGELESWIGRAVLAGALGEYLEMSAGTDFPAVGAKEEYEKTIRVSLRSVPVNIGKSDALSIAEAKIGRSKSQKLKFIPVWHYNYSFSTQKMFKSRAIDLAGEGEGYIHALTGENFFDKYNDIQESAFVPTQNYELKQPAIAKKDALDRAVDAIIREHTKEIRLNEMIGDTIIFENKVFAPDPDDINLRMDLLHIPVWEVRGMGETIEINGYDGHIMTVKAYSDAEFI